MDEIVISGMGAVAANGNNPAEFWESIINGVDGYTGNPEALPADFPFKAVAKLKNFNPAAYLSENDCTCYDRAAQLSLISAKMAVEDAGFIGEACDNRRVAVIMGTTCGTNLSIEEDKFDDKWFSGYKDCIKTGQYKKYHHLSIANIISMQYGFKGPSYVIGTACAAGNHSIGEGYDLIKLGKADIVICGGVDTVSLLPHYGFYAMRSLSDDRCTPFNKNRKGLILGEGAGTLVLERKQSALARKASIYAKMEGWALNCDSHHFASSILNGERCAQLINACLKRTNIKPEAINYINVHGTGTSTNDLMEVNGIKAALGKLGREIPVSSIKSMTGHTLGAAGALEGVIACYCIEKNAIPPNIFLNKPDDGFDLNFITEKNHHCNVDTVLSLSFAFGGCNVATLFSRTTGKDRSNA